MSELGQPSALLRLRIEEMSGISGERRARRMTGYLLLGFLLVKAYVPSVCPKSLSVSSRLLSWPHTVAFFSRRRVRLRPKIFSQYVCADEKYPQRKNQRNPFNGSDAQQEHDHQSIAENRHPVRKDPSTQGDCGCRDHEHTGHLHRIDVHGLSNLGAPEATGTAVYQAL